jgi:hypothetical protein
VWAIRAGGQLQSCNAWRRHQLTFLFAWPGYRCTCCFCSIATDRLAAPPLTLVTQVMPTISNGLNRGVRSAFFTSDHGPPLVEEKANRSAHMRILVRLRFVVTEPHQAAAISTQSRARALMCLRRYCASAKAYFFFLPVFFFAFLAFLAFLAMLPSTIPIGSVQVDLDCTHTEYTTTAKLILRASKKVNGGHTLALLWAKLSYDASTRYLHTACRENIRAEIDIEPGSQRSSSVGAEAILLGGAPRPAGARCLW